MFNLLFSTLSATLMYHPRVVLRFLQVGTTNSQPSLSIFLNAGPLARVFVSGDSNSSKQLPSFSLHFCKNIGKSSYHETFTTFGV
jgi:hypothetical protein